jgi:RNA-directed DNA polymerase
MGGKGEMTKALSSLQDLRRSLYVKAKAEPTWRFWGLYVHVCKKETLHEAYRMAKENDGAPGIDGVTFEAIEESGVEGFLEQIRDELVSNTYRPMRARKKEIPKDGGKKVRVLSIPTIRDRVVQGALKLILEPIFEADFQSGSYGYRPKRTAHQAVNRVAQAIVESKTRIIDIDLRAYFDNVHHYLLLEKVARRVRDDEVMHLLKMMLKATGEKGVPQGGVMTPRTQKITSSLSAGSVSCGSRVRVDRCRIWLYVYDRCRAPASPKKPSASIVHGTCCSMSIIFPMR